MATILYAADDPHLCKILEKSLVSEGHRFFSAPDGQAALRELEQCQPELVLLDVLLPKLDGFQVLERIRKRDGQGQRTPVVLLSSCRVTSQYEERARALRAQALLTKPVALDRLMAVTARYAKPPPPPVNGSRGETPWSGSLSELSFPHLLHQLHGLRATGVLRLGDRKRRKLIQLRDGYPDAIKSNLLGECLGNTLVRSGALEEDVFQESVRRMRRGEGLQGQILIAMEVLDERELAAALERQALDKLFEIFAWTDGRFRFEVGAKLQRANSLSMQRSPANLIVEGVRRRCPIGHVDAFMRRHAKHALGPGGSDFYRFQEIELLPVEEELLAELDGSKTLGECLRLDERTRRTLYGLIVTELLALGAVSGTATRPAVKRKRSEPASTGAGEGSALRCELTQLASGLKGQSYFQMLGIGEDDDVSVVDAAFEKAVARVHPDRFQGSSGAVRQLAADAYQLLADAHRTLSDPRQRAAYVLEQKRGEREAAREAADRKGLDAEIQFQRGEALLRVRSYQEALVCFGAALKDGPEEGEYHAHYGWCLYLCHPDDAGMIHEAVEHVRRGIGLARDRATSYLYLGRLYKVQGRMAAAEKLFTRAVQIQPECVEAVRELRLINLRRGKRGLIGKLLRR